MNYEQNFSLLGLNSLKINEKAAYYCELNNQEEIEGILEFAKQKNLLTFFLGEGTNIVPTKPFDGVIIKNLLKGKKIIDENTTEVASGENWNDFVSWSLSNNKFGLENLGLIPGTVGAAPVQNIGAYGSEVSNFIKEIKIFNTFSGKIETLTAKDCNFDYRTSIFKHRKELFILSVTFRTMSVPKTNITYQSLLKSVDQKNLNKESLSPLDVYDLVCEIRNSVLPDYISYPNVGSFFKNTYIMKDKLDEYTLNPKTPLFTKDNYIKIPSAYLIESCGWKGKRRGGVGISDKHSLVLVNYDQVSGDELLSFANHLIDDVHRKTNITLEIEPTLL